MPRSEINREMGTSPALKGMNGNAPSTSGKPGTPTSSPLISGMKHSGSPGTGPSNLYDSKSALDPKINMEEYAYNKVFVGGLHYDTRDRKQLFLYILYFCTPIYSDKFNLLNLAEFRAYFEKYGKVVSAEIMFNRETHKSRGFGFIVFEHEDGAVRVCEQKEHVIDSKVVSSQYLVRLQESN